MAKLTLTPIGSAYGSIGALNANQDAVEAAIENTLSRDGTGPNAMLADLDMNSNDILNAGSISASSVVINGTEIEAGTGAIIAPATVASYQVTATAGQTTLSVAPLTLTTSSSVVVEVNGVVLPPSAVSITAPSTVVFTTRSAGEVVVVRVFTRNTGGASSVPSPTGQTGKILGSDGTNYVWTNDQVGSGSGGGVEVSVFSYLTAGEIADVQAGTLGVNLTTKIQNAINAVMAVGGTLVFPRGEYRVDSPLVIDYSAETQDPTQGATNRISLQGEGGGASQIVATHGGALLDYRGGTSAGVHSFFNVYGLSFYNSTARQAGSIGIKMDNTSFWRFEDVSILGFETGIYGSDVLSGSYNSGRLWSCTYGFKFEYLNFSRPNAISFRSVAIAGNRRYGGHVIGGALFSMYGGSVEGNGIDANSTTDGDAIRNSCWGLKFEESGVEGVVGATIHGGYFEGNSGKADVWFSQVTNKVTHSITGSSFLRFLSGQYTLYNVLYDNNPAVADCRVTLSGCGFRSQSPYTASASRPYIGSQVGKINNEGNYFENSTEIDRAVFAPSRVALIPSANFPTVEQGGLIFEPAQNGLLVGSNANWRWAEDKNPTIISTDAAATLTVFSTLPTVLHNGTLTATRTLTLSTTGAYVGAKFKVVRLGSGAFNLSVGGLVNLLQNQWAEVVYDGTNWILIGAGSMTPSTSAITYSHVRATRISAITSTQNAVTVLTYNTEEYDTNNEFSTSTGVFKAKTAGYYRVCGALASKTMNFVAGTQWNIRVLKNGTDYAVGRSDYRTTTGTYTASCTVDTTLFLAVNDEVALASFTDRTPDGDANETSTSAIRNYFSVDQLP